MDGRTMPVDFWLPLAIIVICVALSAFFAGAETALTAASRARMFGLERNGDARAATVNRLLGARARLIGAMLLGNTLVNIAASALATSILTEAFGDAGVLIATIAMTCLLLVFAEVLPKTIGINFPDSMSLIVARPAAFFVGAFSPALIAVDWIVGGFLRVLGLRAGEHAALMSPYEELKSAVDLMHKEGGVERAHRDMVGGVIDLEDLTVEDVMIHRTRMRTIDAQLPPREIVAEALASPYTRLPLWKDQPENIIGVLHAKDLLRALFAANGDASKLDAAAIAAPPWFVPETTTLKDQLQAFRDRKTHVALIVDEYGSVMGLVTLEDILEEIVGDIKDEHDVAVQGLRQLPDGSVSVEGAVPIRDLNRVMDWSIPDTDATTIAGLVIHEARAIPDPGQVFSFHGFRFEVLRRQRNRITNLKVTPMNWENDG